MTNFEIVSFLRSSGGSLHKCQVRIFFLHSMPFIVTPVGKDQIWWDFFFNATDLCKAFYKKHKPEGR